MERVNPLETVTYFDNAPHDQRRDILGTRNSEVKVSKGLQIFEKCLLYMKSDIIIKMMNRVTTCHIVVSPALRTCNI